ncbi:MAG: DNA cytosine methyltransferase [Candidatus Azotimanducaceae bacterium WSBS_2022_MAG_OTU7]
MNSFVVLAWLVPDWEERWECLFSNDFDRKKTANHAQHWGKDEIWCGDVRKVTTDDLPKGADLAWASFPLSGLVLSRSVAGLQGERSGTFWPFWDLMSSLNDEGRAPAMIVLENVCGTLTSHGGKDFIAICRSLHDGNRPFGAVIVDAALFVPQSVHDCSLLLFAMVSGYRNRL